MNRKYPTEGEDFQKATKEARTFINILSKKYDLDIAKKAFFRVQREISKKQSLLERKRNLEKELFELNKKVK